MGCPKRATIGGYLTFSICTHDPDTGELTDTDFLPIYRIYEDEIAPPILTGSMAKLDDPGTTGFYAKWIACTAANGFENGKSYTIYMEATVDGRTGGICCAFVARARIIPGVAKVIVEHWPDLIVELGAAGMIVELEHRPDLVVELRADP